MWLHSVRAVNKLCFWYNFNTLLICNLGDFEILEGTVLLSEYL